MSKARRRAYLLPLLPIGLLVLADVGVGLAIRDGEFLGRRIAPFDPPLFNDAQRESLARVRRGEVRGGVVFDAELGWLPDPSRRDIGAFGERVSGSDEGPRAAKRLCVFGGSFTHGDEVTSTEAWPAVLDGLLEGWDVLNFGVSAYGPDQAFLRWRSVADRVEADEVWLGVMPAATPRVLSVYRPALRHHDPSIAFKPRFVTRHGGLELESNPARTLADVVRLVEDQEAFFASTYGVDGFVTRWPSAYRPFGTHWSHRSAIARVLLARMEGAERGPDQEVVELLRGLIIAMREEVEARGATFRVVLLPDRDTLVVGDWPPAELDGTAPIVTAVSGALAGEDELWRPGGHYSAHANARAAAALAAVLDPK